MSTNGRSPSAWSPSGEAEQWVTLQPSAEAHQTCAERQLSAALLPIRLVRVDLPTGEIEVLATSLLDADLYHHRWPVEETYKVMQSRLALENWSGGCPLGAVEAVYQDFHAAVFTKHLVALLAQPAQPVVTAHSAPKQHRYQVNFANLLSKGKDTIVALLTQTHCLDYLHALWRQMLRTVEPIRPKRSCPRRPRVKPKRFPSAYKPLR